MANFPKMKMMTVKLPKAPKVETPESTRESPVQTVASPMTKFNGIKRQLAKDRNLFKKSKV